MSGGIVLPVGKFVALTISGHLILQGFEELRWKLKSLMGLDPAFSSAENQMILDAFKLGVPVGYSRYGILFEVHWIEELDSAGKYILIPRSYGESPADALVKEHTMSIELPDTSDSVKQVIAESRYKIAKSAELGGNTLQSQAVWMELDIVQRTWSTTSISLPLAQAAADQQIQSMESLKAMAAAGPGLQKVRARAAAWRRIYTQYNRELSNARVVETVSSLVQANEQMSREIEEAVNGMRSANASAGFFNAINFLSTTLGLAQTLSQSSEASTMSYIALRDHKVTVIQSVGSQLIKNSTRIKEVIESSIDGITIIPEIYTDHELVELATP